jgi:hypothetical protein
LDFPQGPRCLDPDFERRLAIHQAAAREMPKLESASTAIVIARA